MSIERLRTYLANPAKPYRLDILDILLKRLSDEEAALILDNLPPVFCRGQQAQHRTLGPVRIHDTSGDHVYISSAAFGRRWVHREELCVDS